MRLTKRFLSAATVGALVLGSALSMAPLASAEAGGPTVVLASTSTATTSAASIPVTVTFSDPVTGFTATSTTVTNATITNFAGSGASYTFDLVPSSDGTVTATVPDGVATDTTPPHKTNQASNTLTFTSDRTAPSISGVTASPSTTGATITWNTNESTVGQVFYGTTTSYGSSSTLEVTPSTSHSATLSGLTPSTTYHYQIHVTDGAGNGATTTDATFTTTGLPVAPVITNTNATPTGTSTATVTWNTDTPASSQVFYGTTTSYGSSSTLNTTGSTTHSVNLSGLTQATLYHVQVQSANSVGTTTSADFTFTTDSSATSTPLAVTSVDAVQTNATADDTFVHGWQWIMHLTAPITENAFRMKFSNWTGTSGSFPTASNVRIFSPQSSNANSEATAVTENDTNYGGWLYLNGDTSTTTPGRQIDVNIEVRIPSGTPNGSYTTTYGAQSVPSTATSTTP